MSTTHGRFRRFIRRHSQSLAYLGTSIVFLTFVVKEGIGDRAKAISDSLETATYFHSIKAAVMQNQSAIAFIRTEKIYSDIASMRITSPLPGNRPEDVLIETNMAYMTDALDDAQDSLQSITALIDQLPQREAYKQKIFELQGRSGYFRGKIRQTDEWMSELGLDTEAQKKRDLAVRTREDENEQGAKAVMSEIEDFVKDVLDTASGIRDANAVRSKVAWWISAALFAVGWGLGLLGKIYGVPEAAGGE